MSDATDDTERSECKECGAAIESGIVCDDCESDMDALISAFTALNDRSTGADNGRGDV